VSGNLSMWRRMRGSAEIASCREVGQLLQSYLDGEVVDELAAHRITRHLELCRRCGMEASTYAEIKASLARNGAHATHLDAVMRLREFGQRLVDDPPQR
jgi:predicted anti-sigma-YlaC factor YlaD